MTSLSLTPERATTPLRALCLTLAGAALIALGARAQVPFWPVPMTLQTFSVLLVAAALGPRLGLSAMMAYLGAGALGLPVFAGSPERALGLAYMAGPTGGYLLGFLLAAGLTGLLAAGRGWFGRVAAMLAGLAVIYAAGLAWLAAFVPGPKLLAAGLAPFLAGDLVKAALAATLVSGLNRLRGRAR